MNIDQKLECLKLAVDLVKSTETKHVECKAELMDLVEGHYKWLCGTVSEIDLNDPNSLIDVVDDVAEVIT